MSTTQEANSLSSITSLASNPPKYPRNPTEEKRPSLILYIQRVPGSRDVILTPMKPSRKNVTYEDVANSLYFLHYCTPEEATARSPDAAEEPRKSSDTVRTVVRKPLAPPRPSELPESEVEVKPPLPETEPDRADFPTYNGIAAFLEAGESPPKTQPPQIATIERLGLGRSSSTASTISRKAVPVRNGVQPNPSFSAQQARTRAYSDPRLVENNLNARPPTIQLDAPPLYLQHTSPPAPGSVVTLIRRDPTSAAQWNVGEIRMKAPLSSTDQFNTPNAISVTITTPGYQRFRDHSYLTKLEGESSQLIPSRYFTRNIRAVTEWSSVLDKAKTISQQLPRPPLFDRLSSSSSYTQPTTNTYQQPHPPPQYPDLSCPTSPPHLSTRRPRAKAYTFPSPWDGTCTFLTGTSGRSLKCRHTLPTSSTTTHDPGAPISELRFNLPTSDIFGATPTTFGMDTKKLIQFTDRAEAKFGHLRNKLSGGGKEEAWSSESEEEWEGDGGRYGIGLGQEKAGGGNRGKRAKLGKLIVHDEGLKMLDLVVAANMGIWWEVWER